MTVVPVVDYLSLDDPPRLAGQRCRACGATFLQRHNGCARCGRRDFERAELPSTGVLRAYTIVHRGKAGDPFVSAVVARQLPDPKVGLAHVIGLGSACCVHLLERAAG